MRFILKVGPSAWSKLQLKVFWINIFMWSLRYYHVRLIINHQFTFSPCFARFYFKDIHPGYALSSVKRSSYLSDLVTDWMPTWLNQIWRMDSCCFTKDVDAPVSVTVNCNSSDINCGMVTKYGVVKKAPRSKLASLLWPGYNRQHWHAISEAITT